MLQIRHLPPSRLMMNSFPFAYLALHEGSRRVSLERLDLRPDHALSVELAGAEWLFIWMTETRDEGITQHTLKGQVTRGVASQVALGIGWDFPAWSIENYVLVPGAVYGGNRFVREPDGYPPPTKGPQPGEPRDRLHTIDLPGLRLAEDPAQSWLDQYSLDAAVPGIGVQLAATGEGFFAFTRQLSNVGAYNYEVLENDSRTSAQLLVGTPGLRHEKAYAIPYQRPGGYVLDSDDQAVDLAEGEAIICEVSVHQFACPDRQTLFQRCFTYRDALFQDPPLRKEVPFSYTWDTIHRKQNAVNWRENLSLYQTSILGEAEPPAPTLLFQVGWCGGLIVTYPMLQ